MPARFQFRLETLLKLRKSLKEDAQRYLGRMHQLRMEAEATLEDLRNRHQQSVEARSVERGKPVDLDWWRALDRYLVVLEFRIREAVVALEEANQRVQEAVKALQKAHREHLTLLRLKERRKEQHDAFMLLEEIKTMDEMAVLRHHRPTPTDAPRVREA